ncbi:MAG: PEP/pyruvate-binding domain-containing protein, partial [Candidatus Binatia bacterium]
EETAYASGNDVLKTAERATRRQRLEWLAQAGDSLAGSGLLNLRHADGLRASVARLLAGDPAVGTYRDEVRYLARPPEWAAATFRFHLQDGVDSLSRLDPLARRYPQDRLRGSPLLFYSSVADGLAKDASREAGISHRIFGQRHGAGVRALNPGLARGTIRVPNDPSQIEKFDPRGIYLLPHTTAELPPVAGILTQGEGSSLSHVQLLARNLGIPNVVIGRELVDAIRSRNGKKAVLAVSPSGIVQLEADGQRWNGVFGNQKASSGPRIRPDVGKLDLTVKAFIGLERLRASDAGRVVGPKSANLGELKHAFGGKVPDGVAIPFGAFKQLLDQPIEPGKPTVFAWLQQQYRTIAKMPESAARKDAVKNLLARMRKWTEAVDPGEAFRAELQAAIARLAANGGGLFVRSDTNVEDLPGFTGAGLNRTVPNVVGEEALMRAIREVWASPFTDRSYAWRQSLMDQPEFVFPAVLLQKAFAAEKSGVMVSTDVEGGRPGYLSIAANEGVSGAVDGQAAESLLVSNDGKDVRYLSQATAPFRKVLARTGGVTQAPASGGDTVLQPNEIAELVVLAREAPGRFPVLRGDGDIPPRPADFEFAVAGGELALLQIRPFNESRKAGESTYL